jgi:microcystin-dependent protein
MYKFWVSFILAISLVLPGMVGAQNIEMLLGGSTANEYVYIVNASSDTLAIFKGNKMVGINTTNPTAELEVSGTVKATALVGDGSGLTNTDTDPSNELQVLSISGDTLFLSDGGQVILPGVKGAAAPLTVENEQVVIDTAGVGAGQLLSFDGNNWITSSLVIGNTGGNQPVNNMQPFLGIYHCIALVGLYPSRNIMDPFIGTIATFGFNFAPRSWAFCNGQLLAISGNPSLFSLLGTTFGGDGRTTFGLPDLRGRVAVHPGNGPGLQSIMWGQKSGTNNNTLNINNLPNHTHTPAMQ